MTSSPGGSGGLVLGTSLTVKTVSLSWGGSGGAGTQELGNAEAVWIAVEIVELDSVVCLEHLYEVGRRLGVSALALMGLWSLAALARPEAPFCPQPIAAFARMGERSLKTKKQALARNVTCRMCMSNVTP